MSTCVHNAKKIYEQNQINLLNKWETTESSQEFCSTRLPWDTHTPGGNIHIWTVLKITKVRAPAWRCGRNSVCFEAEKEKRRETTTQRAGNCELQSGQERMGIIHINGLFRHRLQGCQMRSGWLFQAVSPPLRERRSLASRVIYIFKVFIYYYDGPRFHPRPMMASQGGQQQYWPGEAVSGCQYPLVSDDGASTQVSLGGWGDVQGHLPWPLTVNRRTSSDDPGLDFGCAYYSRQSTVSGHLWCHCRGSFCDLRNL